jgi:hypothetical protein
MTQSKLQILTTGPNVPAARVIAGLLKEQGIECHIQSDTPLLGEAQMCAVMVEAPLVERAKRVLAEASFTDAELDFLATGHLSCEDAKE